MIEAEDLRQQAIQRYSLAGEGKEPTFDRVTRLASEIFQAPIALVSVLALERQLFRGVCGLQGEGTPREVAFCDHAVRGRDVFVVEDAQADPRFLANPLVTGEPFIRFYAGAPVRVGADVAIGTLCIIDRVPRSFSAPERKRLAMLAATVSDIIELRANSLLAEEREHELNRQAVLLKGTVENVEQGIAVFSSDFRLRLWNDRFFEFFDFPADLAVLGTPANQLLSIAAARGELGPGSAAAIAHDFIYNTQVAASRRREVTRITGQIFDVWRNRLSNGNLILAVSDVTAARELAQTKDEFISTVNHELRTPLTSIQGSLALLKGGHGGDFTPKAEKLVGIAYQNALRLNTLINDLLDIEKIAKGGLQLTRAPISLNAVLEKAAEQNRPYAQGFNVDIILDIAGEAVNVDADESRLLQALSNLLSNAIKFSPEAGQVDLALSATPSTAVVSVVDRGSGIPSDFHDRLFERFAQANPNDARTKGTGLGLAITKALVEMHGGTISFKTETGEGTTFAIHLPRVTEHQTR